jgi:hypothetical protein
MITVEKGNLIEVTGGNKKQRELTADTNENFGYMDSFKK